MRRSVGNYVTFSTRCLIPSIITLKSKNSFIKNFQQTFDGIPRCYLYIYIYPLDKTRQKARKQASSNRGRRVPTDPFIHSFIHSFIMKRPCNQRHIQHGYKSDTFQVSSQDYSNHCTYSKPNNPPWRDDRYRRSCQHRHQRRKLVGQGAARSLAVVARMWHFVGDRNWQHAAAEEGEGEERGETVKCLCLSEWRWRRTTGLVEMGPTRT